jgi:hypothetical protein
MIWFRRIVAIPLVLVFIILFISLLVVQRVNSTAGNPDFYVDRLRQADIYNFMYHDILPAALDEIEVDEGTSATPVGIEQLKLRLPDTLEQAIPSAWLQAQVEQVIGQVLPYALGDTAGFSVIIPLQDRVAAVAAAVKDLLHDEEFFNDMYDQGVQYAIDKYQEIEDLPSFLRLSDDEAASLLRSVLPADWIQAQVDANIDAIVPYLTGESDSFTLRIDFSERLDAFESAITDILMKPAAYDYVLDEFVVTYIRDNTQDVMSLPVGVSFTDTEIIDLMKMLLTPEWYRSQVNNIVGQVFSYLKGDAGTINISISLAGLEPIIARLLADQADAKLEAMFNALPVGTPEQVADLLANPPVGVLPAFRPPDMSYEDFKDLLSIDIQSMTGNAVAVWLPEQFVITDADIRKALAGEGDEDLLTKARDIVQDGFTYTEADLRNDMADDIDTIDDVRHHIATDYTFTDADLQKYFLDSSDPDAAATWQNLQDVRSIVGRARDWVWAAWLVPALLLVGIGFLGGRNWKSRVIWGASVLAIASLIAYIAAGPVFSAVAKPRIDDALVSAAAEQTSVVGTMAAAKGVAVAEDTINSFVSGINIEAIVVFALCLVVIAVVVWHPWSRRFKGMSGQVPPDNLPPPGFPPADMPPGNLPPPDLPPQDLPPPDQPPDSPDEPTG